MSGNNIGDMVTGKVSDVYIVQLNQGADLYESIHEAAIKYGIRTGLVLNIVGGLQKARLSSPLKPGADVNAQPGTFEVEGTMESSGFGFIGYNYDTFDASEASGIVDKAGEPNIHVHLTVSQGESVHMGHLIDGCIVRSLTERSHFTIMLAKIEGAELTMRLSEETFENYPDGVPCHHLVKL